MNSNPESLSSTRNEDVQTYFDTCNELPAVSLKLRDAAASGPKSRRVYDQIMATVPALQTIELRYAPSPGEFSDTIRVVFWNLEQSVDEPAQHLAQLKPDVILICELDVGMARTAQKHTARELAKRRFCRKFADIWL